MEEFASKSSVQELYKKFDSSRESIFSLNSRIGIIESQISDIASLRETLQELKEAIIKVSCNLETLNNNQDKMRDELIIRIDETKEQSNQKNELQDKEIDKQKSRGKVDILKFLSVNWMKVGFIMYIISESGIRILKG